MSEEETYVGQEEEYAPFWSPTPGETINGKMISVHLMQGDYGPMPVVTIENTSGRHAIMVKGTVFREEMAARRPKPGDDLSVTYLGTKAPKSGKGKPYHVYRVLGGTEPEFDWNAFVPNDRRPDSGGAPDAIPIEPAPIPQPVGAVAAQRQQRKNEETAQAAAENFGETPPF